MNTTQKVSYKGSKVKGLSAEQCAEILMKHYRERAGMLTPEQIVNDARHSKHPLHHYFEWDDAVAADKWRIQQARVLIGSLMIINQKGKEVRMFHNIMKKDGIECNSGFHADSSSYRHIDDVMADDDLMNIMLNSAKRELGWFRKKYSNLKELAEVFHAIEKVL